MCAAASALLNTGPLRPQLALAIYNRSGAKIQKPVSEVERFCVRVEQKAYIRGVRGDVLLLCVVYKSAKLCQNRVAFRYLAHRSLLSPLSSLKTKKIPHATTATASLFFKNSQKEKKKKEKFRCSSREPLEKLMFSICFAVLIWQHESTGRRPIAGV